jgi:hypothetical protein
MTEEEIKRELEELQSHPMFMTEIPENAEDNKHLQALQALKFEGSPSEIAKEFLEKSKESLTKYHKTKKFPDLREAMYYICNAIDHVRDDGTVPDHLKYDLFLFRSEIQVMVKNLGYAVEDLKSALFYVENDSTFFLLIECYIAMEAYEKANKIISTRLKKLQEVNLAEDQNAITNYKAKADKIKHLQNELIENLHKMEAFKSMEDKEKLKLYDELFKKGIKLKPQIHNIPVDCVAKIYQDEDHIFHFPILIIYEEFNSTDYVQDFPENAHISDILDIIFRCKENGEEERLPWDKENKYNSNTCAMFFEISNHDKILKKEVSYYFPMRNDDKLIDVLQNKKVHMNGFPVVVIVSQISSFYPHFLKNKVVIKRK